MRKEYRMHYLVRLTDNTIVAGLTDNTIVAVIMLSCPQFNKAEILLDFFSCCSCVFWVFCFFCFLWGGGGGGGGVVLFFVFISFCFGCVLFSFFF